jgi:hypothetical protein
MGVVESCCTGQRKIISEPVTPLTAVSALGNQYVTFQSEQQEMFRMPDRIWLSSEAYEVCDHLENPWFKFEGSQVHVYISGKAFKPGKTLDCTVLHILDNLLCKTKSSVDQPEEVGTQHWCEKDMNNIDPFYPRTFSSTYEFNSVPLFGVPVNLATTDDTPRVDLLDG